MGSKLLRTNRPLKGRCPAGVEADPCRRYCDLMTQNCGSFPLQSFPLCAPCANVRGSDAERQKGFSRQRWHFHVYAATMNRSRISVLFAEIKKTIVCKDFYLRNGLSDFSIRRSPLHD